jgi:hypothetical protein
LRTASDRPAIVRTRIAYNPDRVGKVVFRPDVFGTPRIDVQKTYIKR